ncbi:TULIP family P47-like protein [Dyadobacter sp. NIV53]|uniref:TULIP family P47-like protein n=1 Tax=Dyadobacter sp. NIV53 TaxID=2861765 RepID=UPI001C86E535|nr:TULIP family P47-like protein [Dyadobacter sp. NIV53]
MADTDTAVYTYGWDTAFVIRAADVNKAIVDCKSSPPNFSYSETESDPGYSVTGDFGDWQIAMGGDGKQIRMLLPLKNVVLTFPATNKVLKYDSGQAIIEISLHFIPHTDTANPPASGSLSALVVQSASDSDNDPVISMVSLVLSPTPGLVAESVIREGIIQWGTNNLQDFSHVFAIVNLNRIIDTDQWGFVNPNYTSYAYLDLDTIDNSLFGVLCMTGDRTGESLSEQISVSAIHSPSRSGFLVSQARTLYDLVRPAICLAYPGLTDSNFLMSPDGTKLYLTEGSSVDLKSIEHNGTTYYPKLKSLSVESNGQILTLISYTETEVAAGITATCTSTHWYTISMGSSNNGQTLSFVQYKDPSIVNAINQSSGSQLTQIIIDIVASIVLIILVILTEGAVLIVGAVVIGLVLGANQMVPALIEKLNMDDSPSIDLLLANTVDPITWTGSKAFKLDYGSMNASLQLGGDPLFV